LGDISTVLSNYEVIKAASVVFLCVKPGCLDAVASSLTIKEHYANPDDCHTGNLQNTLVSILAGTSLRDVKKAIPMFKTYVRAMPNTALQAQAGCTAITKLDGISNDIIDLNYKVVKAIFGSIGTVDVIDEDKFHAITAVSGSGVAYVYIMIEAMSDAGVKQGLPRDIATKFAAQTFLGASKTVLESGFHCGQLKDQVTSAGGTTIHAIHELERGGIRNTLFNAVEAATKRSKEMSN
jgi:pyrroline-5-carboxylate reductase